MDVECILLGFYAGERWSERAFFFELTSPKKKRINVKKQLLSEFSLWKLQFAEQILVTSVPESVLGPTIVVRVTHQQLKHIELGIRVGGYVIGFNTFENIKTRISEQVFRI